MTADALVSRHTAARQAASVHPFLAGVREGSVPPANRLCAGGLGGRDLDFGGGLDERQQFFVQAR